jgi:hypothetical protein
MAGHEWSNAREVPSKGPPFPRLASWGRFHGGRNGERRAFGVVFDGRLDISARRRGMAALWLGERWELRWQRGLNEGRTVRSRHLGRDREDFIVVARMVWDGKDSGESD